MLFIILQVRSEQTAACVSLAMMIPYDYSEHLDVSLLSEVPSILSNLPKLANMQC